MFDAHARGRAGGQVFLEVRLAAVRIGRRASAAGDDAVDAIRGTVVDVSLDPVS
jgi:hypothetical protein